MFPELRRDLNLPQYYQFIRNLESQHPDIICTADITPGKEKPLLSVTAAKGTGSKQNVLLTAMHSGVEYSGSNTLIKLLKWLVSGDTEAEKALVLCKITFVPVPNPHGYDKGDFNGQFHTELGGDPYAGPWTVGGVTEPETNWEAYSIQRLIDDLRPELYIDCHGVFYKNQTMIENTGVSVHGMNRPHHTGFVDAVNDAAKLLGYHSEQFEIRQKPLPVLAELADRRYQRCSPAITSCTYAYHNYHTLSMAMEIGNEESGLARLKKALSLADFHWAGERSPGYPVNRLFGEGHSGMHPCSGKYPDKRLERIRLWQAVNNYATASIQPQYPGHEGFMVLSPKDAGRLGKIASMPVMFKELKGDGHSDRWLGLNLPVKTKFPPGAFSISLKIPFAESHIRDITVNGYPADNYDCVSFGTFSMVFMNFPEGIHDTTLVEIKYDYSAG